MIEVKKEEFEKLGVACFDLGDPITQAPTEVHEDDQLMIAHYPVNEKNVQLPLHMSNSTCEKILGMWHN